MPAGRVPFVAKATGVPVAMVAARVMTGATLAELRDRGPAPSPRPDGAWVSVKEAVLPFGRFPGVDTLLGPEMRSTGEVMGIGATFGLAFAKSQIAAGTRLPSDGAVFLSLADRDKAGGLEAARTLQRARVRPGRHVGHRRVPRVQRRPGGHGGGQGGGVRARPTPSSSSPRDASSSW